MTQQAEQQASVRNATATTLDYNGDWSALFDQAGIPAGDFNGRMILWISQTLAQAYDDVNAAKQAFAAFYGAYNFSSLGGFPVSAPSTAPANTVAPAISGIQTQGQTLTASNGTWTGSPTSYTYQWNRAAVPIASATAQTYVLQAADVGQAINCTVTATNTSGSASADSNTVTPAATLTISGTPATTATVGASYSFTPTTAGGHTPKTFSVVNKPSWATFTTATGQLTGTPSATETDAGINITVTDNDGLTASLGAWTITVSNPPNFNAQLEMNIAGKTGPLAALGIY